MDKAQAIANRCAECYYKSNQSTENSNMASNNDYSERQWNNRNWNQIFQKKTFPKQHDGFVRNAY